MDPSDARRVARINLPHDFGCDSDSLDVCNDIGFRIEQAKVEDLVSGICCDSDSLDFSTYIDSGI